MSEHDTLFQQIMDRPEDDEPRLAYADFLESGGQTDRAEFIRIQCSLHSSSLEPEQRADLKQREKELLDQYAWDWAEEFGQEITEWQFERGFVTRIETALERPTEDILNVVNRGPVTHLRDVGQFCDLQDFVNGLPQLARLTGLEFWNLYAFEDQLVGEILQSPHLKNLKTLILHHDRNGNTVDEQVIVDGLRHPNRANTEYLAVNVDCSWRGPTNPIIDAIATSPYLRNLRRLDLSNAGDSGNNPQLNVETIRRLSESPNLNHVEILDLRNVHATANVWEAILEMPLLKRLKKLYLCNSCEVPKGEWIPIVGETSEIPKWRSAFDNLDCEVDWETRFIDPWSDATEYWSGHTWSERRQRVLFGIADYATRSDFDGLEQHYQELCLKNSGEKANKEVAKIKFDRWARKMQKSLKKAIAAAEKRKSLAIVLRIRPDINWQSRICVHDQYGRDFDNTPDDSFEPFEEYSYSGPDFEVDAGNCEAAGKFFMDNPLSGETRPNYASVYLIARSLAAFGRVVEKLDPKQRIYCSFMAGAFRLR